MLANLCHTSIVDSYRPEPVPDMFQKLLVALDLSKNNEFVFQTALELAKSIPAQMVLIHAPSQDDLESPSIPALITPEYVPSIGSSSVIDIYEELWRAYLKKGHQMLQDFETQAIAEKVAVEFIQHPGIASKMICKFAKSTQADLIVMGRRGHSGWSEFMAGSVSNYVMHHAPCSVLVVQQTDQPQIIHDTNQYENCPV